MSYSRRNESSTSSFGAQGLASNLPRPGESRPSAAAETRARDEAPAASDSVSSWRRGDANRAEPPSRSTEGGSAWGSSGRARASREGEESRDFDRSSSFRTSDRFSRNTEQAPLKMNSRTFGDDTGADREGGRFGRDREGDRDRDRDYGRGDRDGGRGFGGEREGSRGFGGDRDRDSRGFGGDRDRERGFGGDRDRERSFGGDRERSFGGDRERSFGGERERSFGGDRDGGRGGYGRDRDGGRDGGRFEGSRGFGGDRDRERDSGRPATGGEGRYEPPGRRERSDRSDRAPWEDEGRKFGGARRGDRDGGDGDRYMPRREREALNPNFRDDMKGQALPTAPRATLSNSAFAPKKNVFEMAVSKAGKKDKKAKKTQESNKKQKGDDDSSDEEDEEESSPAPEAAPAQPAAPVVEVPKVNVKEVTMEVVREALAAGSKGAALAGAIKSAYEGREVGLPLSVLGLVLAVLQHVQANEGFSSKWYKADQYGGALKSIIASRSMKDQLDSIYAVQEFCHGLKFPKLDVNGKQKKLIDVLVTAFLVSEVADVDVILGWADDETDRADVPGRMDAIVQLTATLSTLREPDEVEDADIEDDAHIREVVK